MVQVEEETVEVPQLQIVEKIVETPEIQMVQTSEGFGKAPVLQVAQGEIVEAVVIGALLPAESGPPMFVKAHVLEAPVVVEHVPPTPVVEYMANVCTTRSCSRCEVRDSSTYRC